MGSDIPSSPCSCHRKILSLVPQQAQLLESSPQACLHGHCWRILPRSQLAPGSSAFLLAQLACSKTNRGYRVPRTSVGQLPV